MLKALSLLLAALATAAGALWSLTGWILQSRAIVVTGMVVFGLGILAVAILLWSYYQRSSPQAPTEPTS